MTRVRGYAPWRPQTRTRLLLDQVVVVLAEYADYLPLTIRQVFYRLVGNFGYDKTENAYERLSEMIGRARRSGRLDWDAIRDDGTRHLAERYTALTPEQYLAELAPHPDDATGYRLDPQRGQPQRIEVWCEAAGMAPMLSRVCREFGIPVYSSSGFDSLTFKRDTSLRAARTPVPLVVLHIGDHDPSGVHLFSSAASDCTAMAATDGGVIEFERVAVLPGHVSEYGLPTAPPKSTDRRSFSGQTVQAEALPPDVLIALLREAITARWDAAAAQAVLIEQGESQAWLRAELSRMRDLLAGES